MCFECHNVPVPVLSTRETVASKTVPSCTVLNGPGFKTTWSRLGRAGTTRRPEGLGHGGSGAVGASGVSAFCWYITLKVK